MGEPEWADDLRAVIARRVEAMADIEGADDPDDALAGAMPEDERSTSGVGWPE